MPDDLAVDLGMTYEATMVAPEAGFTYSTAFESVLIDRDRCIFATWFGTAGFYTDDDDDQDCIKDSALTDWDFLDEKDMDYDPTYFNAAITRDTLDYL